VVDTNNFLLETNNDFKRHTDDRNWSYSIWNPIYHLFRIYLNKVHQPHLFHLVYFLKLFATSCRPVSVSTNTSNTAIIRKRLSVTGSDGILSVAQKIIIIHV